MTTPTNTYMGLYAVAADNSSVMPKNRNTGLRFQKPNVNKPLFVIHNACAQIRSNHETRDSSRVRDVLRKP